MPDRYGFATVRERELEIEIDHLRRENDHLRHQARRSTSWPDDPQFAHEHKVKVQKITPTYTLVLPLTASVRAEDNDVSDQVIVRASCTEEEGVFEVAEYVSRTVLSTAYSPAQVMMELYRRGLEQVARRYEKI